MPVNAFFHDLTVHMRCIRDRIRIRTFPTAGRNPCYGRPSWDTALPPDNAGSGRHKRPRQALCVVLPERYTGEGYPTGTFDLIRDGKLVSFSLSQYGANKTGGARAGNSGSGLTVKNGEKTLEEIISTIDKGILVMRFSGGSPAPSGEYSGVAKNSFLIKNGKIASALTETMISGCVPDMLNNIRAVSSDLLKDGDISTTDASKTGPKNMLDDLSDSFNEAQLEALRVSAGKTKEGTKRQLRVWMSRGFIEYSTQTGLFSKTKFYLGKV